MMGDSTTSVTFRSVYLETSYWGQEVGAKKKEKKETTLKMVYFAASTLGLTSLKKVDFAGFGYSLVSAVDRGSLELFLL